MVDNIGKARKGLAIFFTILVILSGLVEWMILRTGEGIDKHLGLIFLLMWTPAIASIVARLVLREGIKDVSFRLKGAFGLKTLIGWLYPVAVGLIAYGAAWLTGLAIFSSSVINFIFLLVQTLFIGTITAAIFTTGEEIGWRGYMLTRLFDAKIPHPIFISSVIWGLWHLPMIISGQYSSGPNLTLSTVIFMVFIIPTTYFISWLRLQTGSIWPPVIFHASWNSLIQGVFDRSTKDPTIWLGESGILVALVGIVLVFFIVRGQWTIKHSPDDENAIRADLKNV